MLTTTPLPTRLSLVRPEAGPHWIDSAWWPHSRDLTDELPILLASLNHRWGRITRVTVHTEMWPVPSSYALHRSRGAHQPVRRRRQPPQDLPALLRGGPVRSAGRRARYASGRSPTPHGRSSAAQRLGVAWDVGSCTLTCDGPKGATPARMHRGRLRPCRAWSQLGPGPRPPAVRHDPRGAVCFRWQFSGRHEGVQEGCVALLPSVMGTHLPRWRCAVRRGRRRGRPVQGLIGAGSPLCLLSVVTGHLLFDDAGRLLAAGACAGPERDGRGDAAPLVYLRVGGVGGREAAVRGGPGWVRRGGGTSFVGVPSRLKGRPPVTRGLDPRRPAGRAIGVSTTVNPAPWRATTTPSFRRTSIALTTVARDTPNCSVSSRPDGRRSPGANSPSVMRARR